LFEEVDEKILDWLPLENILPFEIETVIYFLLDNAVFTGIW
jgi:hypothetical protein